jgi:HEAT repeat protein
MSVKSVGAIPAAPAAPVAPVWDGSFSSFSSAPAPWAPQDPADSLYRAARDNLNRGEYRRAAEIFAQIPQRFPTSTYTPDSYYYQALSLYRVGGQNDLRSALTALETLRDRYANHRVMRGGDASTLSTRILGTLAAQGDASARQRLAQAAQAGTATCDREEMAIKIEALNALSRMSPDSTAPILRTVLNRRDVCSTSLRRNALILLGKQPEAERTGILVDVARSDPSVDVRRDAVALLGRTPSERSLAALESIVNSPSDSLLHSTALRALREANPARARDLQRSLIESPTASERVKSEAINVLAQDTSAAAAAYLRSVYPRLQSRTLKTRTLSALTRRPNSESVSFLMGIARNTAEPMEFRRSAVQVTRTAYVPLQEVSGLFDAVTELDLRLQIVAALGVRREPEATDKLLSIARNPGNPPEIRRSAINALTGKDDPRTRALLLEIIGG